MEFAYVIAKVASALIVAIEIAMFVRAILSWIPGLDDSSFGDLVYTLTEPIIAPVRMLADRMGWFQGVPIDIPFMITYLLLFVVQGLLDSFVQMVF